MKHKKLMVVTTLAIFVSICVFCILSLFTVSDIKINYTMLKDNSLHLEITDQLQKYEGKNIWFLKTDKIKKEIENNGYLKVVSIKKDYPNKISVTIQERIEVFALFVQGEYYVLDDGYQVIVKKQENVNKEDGVENILLTVELEEFNVSDIKIGRELKIKTHPAFRAMDLMYRQFEDCRNAVSEIRISATQEKDNYRIYFVMVEGVEIEIRQATDDGENKILRAIEKYLSLSDKDKTRGKILGYSGTQEAVYSTDSI